LTILSSLSCYLHSPELLDAVRLNLKAFIRNRKLPFPKLLTLMLSGMTASVQQELDRLSGTLQGSPGLLNEVSAQAFSKARKGFSAKVFRLLNRELLSLAETHLPIPRWRGLRVAADDASKLQLFLKDATARKVREAVAFMLYLPGLELALDFEIYSPSVAERQMLLEHLQSLRKDDLLVLDRGYPSCWLVAVLVSLGIPFCIRVDGTGFAAARQFRRSGLRQAVVTLAPPSAADATDYGCPRQPSTVRLILVATPNGQRHAVMTSLLGEAAYPAAGFADLYHARWRIEEAFKRIKHRLALEQLSGTSWLAAQQGFGAPSCCAATSTPWPSTPPPRNLSPAKANQPKAIPLASTRPTAPTASPPSSAACPFGSCRLCLPRTAWPGYSPNCSKISSAMPRAVPNPELNLLNHTGIPPINQ
jgi:hypothetical protein